MSEEKKPEIFTQEYYDILRKITSAQSVLQNDIRHGMRFLATEAVVLHSKEPERADAVVDSAVALLLGMSEEVRHFALGKLRDINPNSFPEGKEYDSAREEYERLMESCPPTLEELRTWGKENADQDMTAEVTHRVVKLNSEEGAALLSLLNRLEKGGER